jgi:hypothetical protein
MIIDIEGYLYKSCVASCHVGRRLLLVNNFSKNSGRKDGYQSACKNCVSLRIKNKKRKENPNYVETWKPPKSKLIEGILYKVCSSCKDWLLLEINFSKWKSTPDGYEYFCRECNHRRSLKNPFKSKLYGLRGNAKRRGIFFELTANDLENKWNECNGNCSLLGTKLILIPRHRSWRTTATVDRIDTTKGYTRDNIMWLSSFANWTKKDMTLEELDLFCKNWQSLRNKIL